MSGHLIITGSAPDTYRTATIVDLNDNGVVSVTKESLNIRVALLFGANDFDLCVMTRMKVDSLPSNTNLLMDIRNVQGNRGQFNNELLRGRDIAKERGGKMVLLATPGQIEDLVHIVKPFGYIEAYTDMKAAFHSFDSLFHDSALVVPQRSGIAPGRRTTGLLATSP